MVGLKGKDKEVLSGLETENRNPRTLDLDLMNVGELLIVMNEEDKNIIEAAKQTLPQIQEAIETIICALNKGGKLVYAGVGTGGRLGILDAVECLPTFSTTDEVVGIMAGSEKAFVHTQKGMEDSKKEGRKDLGHLEVDERDVVVALFASGRTPYCISALEYAREAGACCVGLSCSRPTKLTDYSDIVTEMDAGPEILTRSTRLKAGIAEEMVLNMISTAAMVGIGKVYGDLMVGMWATNLRLAERAKRIVSTACGCAEEATQATPELANGRIKATIVMILTGITAKKTKERLEIHKGFVRKCLDGVHDHG